MRFECLFAIPWLLIIMVSNSWASYEVKGKCIGTSVFFAEGKAKQSPCSDEIIYEVMPEESKIVRKAVVSSAGGLQADNSEYTIVYDEPNASIPRNGKRISQHIIKGFGQVAAVGGYEIVVIGDDFITTAKSAVNYFTLYYYQRE